jgi:hypothetical protein
MVVRLVYTTSKKMDTGLVRELKVTGDPGVNFLPRLRKMAVSEAVLEK